VRRRIRVGGHRKHAPKPEAQQGDITALHES
jgi:hypothetical protein